MANLRRPQWRASLASSARDPGVDSGIGELGLVDSSTLHQRVYQEIIDALMTGRFRPGEVVTLRGLAEVMGTSLMPVREAVRRLVSEHALEMPNSRSTRVPRLTADDLDQLSAVRLLLEPEAAALAAAHRPADARQRLDAINNDVIAAYHDGDFRGFLFVNRAFHSAVYAMSGNTRLMDSIDRLWIQSGPFLNLLRQHWRASDFGAFATTHAALIDAIATGDSAGARQAIIDLLAASTPLLRRLVEADADR